MPTYEYRCDACGHEFEKEQRITEKPLKKCPSCGAMKARRMVGGSGFILKGGGWYADLYGTPSPSKAGGGDEPKAGSTSEPTADAKTKPKAEAKAAPKAAKPKKAKAAKP